MSEVPTRVAKINATSVLNDYAQPHGDDGMLCVEVGTSKLHQCNDHKIQDEVPHTYIHMMSHALTHHPPIVWSLEQDPFSG